MRCALAFFFGAGVALFCEFSDVRCIVDAPPLVYLRSDMGDQEFSAPIALLLYLPRLLFPSKPVYPPTSRSISF